MKVKQHPRASLSHKLLHHDHLLTPLLHHSFGEVYTNVKKAAETDSIYTRDSSIHQKNSHALLLEATLTVVKSSFPSEFIESLRKTQIPFGDLVALYHVDIAISKQSQGYFEEQFNGEQRSGRHHTMVSLPNHEPICFVRELLVSEEKLNIVASNSNHLNSLS